VLEARDRVGGRAWRVPLGSADEFDLGCEVLDAGHAALLALAADVGVETWAAEGWPEPEPALDGEELALFWALGDEIRSLAERIDPLHPLELDGAAALDRQTLGGWLAQRGATARVLAAAEISYGVASASVPISAMSLLAFAAKQAAGAARHGLRLRFRGGPSALAERLAGDVCFGARVVGLEQDAGGVTVGLGDGTSLRCAGAVVAVPLTLQRELRFDPPLPSHRLLALERARYGDVVKAGFLFEERFWEPGFVSLGERGVVYEPTPGRPVLGVFAGAGAARFPVLGAVDREPRAAVSADWASEPFSRGSYLIFGPSDLTDWGTRLAEPHGQVHFAGAETSELPSYMEGAIRAGERVAREVAAAS
jgi:monoamine oxidase